MWGDRSIPMSFFESLSDARKTLKEQSILSLEWQTKLIEWLKTTTSVDAYAQFMRVYGYKQVTDPGARRLMGQWLHNEVKSCATQAMTYYVSGDMCEMVKLAAEELDVRSGLQATDMPNDRGFLVFDRPMPLYGPGAVQWDDGTWDMAGENIQITAVMWEKGEIGLPEPGARGEERFSPGRSHATAPGVKYWLFATPHDSAACMNQTIKRRTEDRMRELGIEVVEPVIHLDEDGNPVEWITEEQMRREQGPLNIYDFSGWTFGVPWTEVSYDESDDFTEGIGGPENPAGLSDDGEVMRTHPIVNQARRFLLATWRMLNQRIVKVESNKLGKRHPTAKRAARVMPCDGDILIIRLRREFNPRNQAEDAGESGEVWWTHRWLSRGHWRRPKGSAPTAEKTEWVSPSIKGPAHLPLVTKRKIGSLEQ